MESLADAVDGAVPRLQQIGMGQRQFAAAEDFGLLLRGQIVAGVRFVKNLGPMCFKPGRESPPIFPAQRQNGGFQLFQAHGRKSSPPLGPLQGNGGRTGARRVSGASQGGLTIDTTKDNHFREAGFKGLLVD